MAKRFKAELRAEDVIQLWKIRTLEDDEARARDMMTTFRALCKLEHEVTVPKQYEAITKRMRTPFVRDAHHRITSSLVAKRPIPHCIPKDDKRQDYREAANITERFDSAMIERFSKEIGSDIVYELAAAHVRDGDSVLSVVHKPDAWAYFPMDANKEAQDNYKKGVDLPIAWRCVDRACMLFEGGDYGDAWAIEYGEYTSTYLKARYGMVEVDGQLKDPRRILEGAEKPEGESQSRTGYRTKIQYFDEREWHIVVDSSEVPGWPKPNPYSPHLPYHRARAYEGESLLYSLLFLVPRLDEILTMKMNWGVLGAYPTPILKRVPNSNSIPGLDGPLGEASEGGGANQRITWTPGKLFEVPIGYDIEYLVPPPVGRDLNELALLIKSMIDIAGVPSIMRGMGSSGDSGYHAAQMRAAAEMAYKLATVALARQLEKGSDFTHWMVEHLIQQTVYVRGWDSINPKTGKPTEKADKAWLGLSPDSSGKSIANLSLVGPTEYQFRPTMPTDAQANAMIALQLTNAPKPLSDRRGAIEKWLQDEDPDSVMEAIAVEDAMAEEPLKSMWVQEGLRKAGMLPKQGPQLVDQYGQPMQQQGGPGAVPMAQASVAGGPSVPGLNMPIQPGAPQAQGVPGNTGGREAGMYPGRPGGPSRQ